MIYNESAIDSLMHKDTKKVTILREPMENFRSSWIYYSELIHELREKLQTDNSKDGQYFYWV